MKQVLITIALAALGTGLLLSYDHNQRAPVVDPRPTAVIPIASSGERMVHAPGRIEGARETTAIRSEFAGRIAEVAVVRGQSVTAGQLLFALDARPYVARRDMAAAAVQLAKARKQKLIDGARQSEIEAVRQDVLAAEAKNEYAQTRFGRGRTLLKQNAISHEELDALRSGSLASTAMLEAARERLKTIQAPPRDWDGPRATDPAVELASPQQRRVVADIDERDVMLVRLGQRCQVTTDAQPGKRFAGRVSEVEPRMEPKKIYGGWAGERNETHTRRVWIDLDKQSPLPIGLPVEVAIDVQ